MKITKSNEQAITEQLKAIKGLLDRYDFKFIVDSHGAPDRLEIQGMPTVAYFASVRPDDSDGLVEMFSTDKAKITSHIDTLVALKKKFKENIKYTVFDTADISVVRKGTKNQSEVCLDTFCLQDMNLAKIHSTLEKAIENALKSAKNDNIKYTSKVGSAEVSEYTLKEFIKEYK